MTGGRSPVRAGFLICKPGRVNSPCPADLASGGGSNSRGQRARKRSYYWGRLQHSLWAKHRLVSCRCKIESVSFLGKAAGRKVMSGEGVLQVPFSSGCRLDPPGPRPALLWVGAGLVPPKYPPALPQLENSYRLLHKVNIDR